MSSRSRGISMIALGMLLCVVRVGGGEETGKKLGGIQKKIEKQREGLTEVRKEEGSMLRALDVIENKLEKKNSQLRAIKGRLVVIRRELGDKEEELNRLAGSLEKRKELLHRRAKALYKWHRGGSPLMVFMGKGTLGEVMRRKRYLELMLGRDQVLLENLLAEANRHDEVREELSTKRQDLDREKKTVEKLRASISGERKKKRVLLSRLRREKEVRAQVLEELEQAANRLQQVMEKLDHQSGRVSRNESFEGGILVQGRLELPVHGEVVRGFGKTKHPEFPAELFRKGINIRAPLGERVRAVERGRVVFARNFFGYGKMIIIDHGERYHTVYAHLADLLKKLGEVVDRGEPIALLGESGSLAGPRLYFEIRRSGKPVNPLPWFGGVLRQ